MLHPAPLFFLLPYCRYVTARTWLYAFLLERWYFLLVEGQPFGTGSTTNIIYDFRPHLPARTFLLSQYLTNLGYLFTAISRISISVLRIFCQCACIAVILFVCIIHTDRWKHRAESLPEFSRHLVGAALDVPAEPYTMLVNEMSVQLQKRVIEHADRVMQRQLDIVAAIYTFDAPRFNVTALWSALPKELALTDAGLLTVQGTVLLWDRLADACASFVVRLHQIRLPVFWSQTTLDIPSLEWFQAMLPNVELQELATVRSLLAAMTAAFQYGQGTGSASTKKDTDPKSDDNPSPLDATIVTNDEGVDPPPPKNQNPAPPDTPPDASSIGSAAWIETAEKLRRMLIS